MSNVALQRDDVREARFGSSFPVLSASPSRQKYPQIADAPSGWHLRQGSAKLGHSDAGYSGNAVGNSLSMMLETVHSAADVAHAAISMWPCPFAHVASVACRANMKAAIWFIEQVKRP